MSAYRPEKLKIAAGQPGHRPPKHSPAVPRGTPECPTGLPAGAKSEWGRITALLDEYGLLSRLDRAAVADYCLCCARLDQAEAEITKSGLLIPGERGLVKNPACQLAKQYRMSLAKWCELFGFAPGPRGRMNVPPANDDLEQVLTSATWPPSMGGSRKRKSS